MGSLRQSKMAQMFDDIMSNMDKELQQQRGKVNQLNQQRQMIGRRLEMLEQNMAENKVVWMEILETEKEEGASPQCYKNGAGFIIPQTLEQVKTLIDKRGQALHNEMGQMRKGFSECSKKFQEEQKALQELNQKAQQIKEALADIE